MRYYEVKLIKEIRNYTEGIYFGLNTRQMCGAITAIGMATFVYLSLKDHMDDMLVSWICILAAAPGAAIGFFKYQGLTAEKFFVVFLRYLVSPKRLIYQPRNLYIDLLKKGKDTVKHENATERKRNRVSKV